MILVLGATGHTGQRIAANLHRRGASMRLAARDAERLDVINEKFGKKYECVAIDIQNPGSLDTAMRGAKVVINCIGPFTQYGEPVVAAALRNQLHYLDITGEQHFMKTMFGKYGGAFKDQGIALMPGCAFEYAIGETAAAFMAADVGNDWDAIELLYSFDGVQVSRGTKKSVIQAMSSPAFVLSEKILVPSKQEPILTGVKIPGKEKSVCAFPFPGGEVLLLPLFLNVRTIKPYMAVEGSPFVLKTMSQFGPIVVKTLGNFLSAQIDAKGKQPDEATTERTTFVVVCTGKTQGKEYRVIVRGTDPYKLTAVIAAASGHFLDNSDIRMAGPASASMINGPQMIMDETAQFGSSWSKSQERVGGPP